MPHNSQYNLWHLLLLRVVCNYYNIIFFELDFNFPGFLFLFHHTHFTFLRGSTQVLALFCLLRHSACSVFVSIEAYINEFLPSPFLPILPLTSVWLPNELCHAKCNTYLSSE
jgi:hypothetical protein